MHIPPDIALIGAAALVLGVLVARSLITRKLTATSPLRTIAVASAALVIAAGAAVALPSAASSSTSCPCTIWSSTAVPKVAAAGDARANELGVKFQTDVAGYVTGIRFYKGTGNTGTHVGHLWTTSGTLLASATFSSESATGWQQVMFAQPVSVAANTPYIASYYAPNGHYSADQYALASAGVDNPPLHALRNGAYGYDGVYRYAGSGFPVSTYHASNYWVDVVFATPGAAGPAPSAPTSTSPTTASSSASSSAPAPTTSSASAPPTTPSSSPTSASTSASAPPSTSASVPPSTSAAPSTSSSAPPGQHKVLVVIEENNDQSTAMANMPHLASWASTYGQATNYNAITHPSLPNYLAIWGGSTFGVTSDCSVAQAGCVPAAPSIWGQTLAAGKTAKAYEESMPSACYSADSGTYAPRHGPWAYWTDPTEQGYCMPNDVPSGTTSSGALLNDVNAGTLPVVGEVTPNLCNDAHDCSLATADNWLNSWIPKIMAGPDYTSGNLTILITFDEGSAASNNIAFVAIDPRLHGVTVTGSYNHYSLERWLASIAGVAPLRNAATAPDLRAAFGL